MSAPVPAKRRAKNVDSSSFDTALGWQPSKLSTVLLRAAICAIILFIYCLIGISQIVLRFRSGSAGLRVKMWLFPVLSILTASTRFRSPFRPPVLGW